jgi:hypothetical protein
MYKQNQRADDYVICSGESPEKLYGSIRVDGKIEYCFNGANRAHAYYFQLEAFNSKGISEWSEIVKSE